MMVTWMVAVAPDHGCHDEDSGCGAGVETRNGACAVLFEGELPPQGVDDDLIPQSLTATSRPLPTVSRVVV